RAWAAARLLVLTPPSSAAADLPGDLRDLLSPDVLGEWLLTADGQFATLASLVDRRVGRRAPQRGLPTSPSVPSESKPLSAPTLDGDVRIESTLRLPAGAVARRSGPGPATRRVVRTAQRRRGPELCAFVLTGALLVARLGEHHLLAFHPKRHQIAWILGAHGHSRFASHSFSTAARFETHFSAIGEL